MGIDELKKILLTHRKEISEKYRVKEIGFFGSFARGEQSRSSDLDVLVEFEAAPSFFGFIKLEDYLSGLFGVKVDLVRKKALRPELREIILKEAVYP